VSPSPANQIAWTNDEAWAGLASYLTRREG